MVAAGCGVRLDVSNPANPADAPAETCAMNPSLRRRPGACAERQHAFGSLFVAAADAEVGRLRAGEVGGNATAPGEAMPSFLPSDVKARLVGLKNAIAQGPAGIRLDRGHGWLFRRIEADFRLGMDMDDIGADCAGWSGG